MGRWWAEVVCGLPGVDTTAVDTRVPDAVSLLQPKNVCESVKVICEFFCTWSIESGKRFTRKSTPALPKASFNVAISAVSIPPLLGCAFVGGTAAATGGRAGVWG